MKLIRSNLKFWRWHWQHILQQIEEELCETPVDSRGEDHKNQAFNGPEQ
jgi:hypothetical protein